MAADFPASFLAAIERSVLERAGRKERDEIRFRCPSEDHLDEHPSARWSSKKAVWFCDACRTGGSAKDLADRLGVMRSKHGEGGAISPHSTAPVHQTSGCTLEEYAEAKRLLVEFLRQLGLSTISYQGSPAVRVPYLTRRGDETAVRFRISLNARDRFRWRKGDKPELYGQDRLDMARDRGYIILVEGESDCHTLWYHGEPAIGLAGAGSWKEERDAWLLDGIDRIYIVVEPDTGGEAVRRWLDRSSIRHRAHILNLGDQKDPSGFYLCDTNTFPDRWRAALATATSWEDLAGSEVRQQLAEAWQQCEALACASNILDRMADELSAAGVAGERRTIKLLYLILVSRFLDRPVSAAIKGPSSGGKSYTLERVLQLFPADSYHALSAMSERALAYGDEPLAHRFLVIYEAAGLTGDFASYLIRSLLSEGKVRYETVEKTREGIRPRLIEREGPTGLLVTTTAVKLHPENETRLLSIPVTDTPDQTREILRAIALDARQEIALAPWHALQVWLAQAENRVTIPYAIPLSELVPPVAVRLRRDFGLLLSLIRAHAILQQATRNRDVEGRIVAHLDDYATVRTLIADLVAEGVGATVQPSIRETVEAARMLLSKTSPATRGSLALRVRDDEDRTISMATIAQALKLDSSTTSRRVKVACERGYLRNLESRRGQPAKIALGEPLPTEIEVLPEIDVLEQYCSDAMAKGSHEPPSPDIDDQALQAMVTNLLELTPAELVAFRAELASVPPHDPHVAHDLEALRRAEAILRNTPVA